MEGGRGGRRCVVARHLAVNKMVVGSIPAVVWLELNPPLRRDKA